MPLLVQAWRRLGDKSISEIMMYVLLTRGLSGFTCTVYFSGHNWFIFIDRGFQTYTNTGLQDLNIARNDCNGHIYLYLNSPTNSNYQVSGWYLMNIITHTQTQSQMLIAHSKIILSSSWMYLKCNLAHYRLYKTGGQTHTLGLWRHMISCKIYN